MPKRVHLFQDTEDINIMPLMNIVMLLIPFLLMSTDFLAMRIGVIDTELQKGCGCGLSSNQREADKTPPLPLNLSIVVSDGGFELLTRGQKISSSCDLNLEEEYPLTLFKKKGSKNDTQALAQCLAKIKRLFPHERRLLMLGSEKTAYEEVVELMDASRETATKEELFPQVLLSTGIFVW